MSTTRDVSADLKVDRLDLAIDQVTALLVAVPDDGEMTRRIVSALPQRTSRVRWLLPQLAAIGAIVIAALFWTTRSDTPPTLATLPTLDGPRMHGLAKAVAANEPGTALRTMPLESASARNDSRELRRDLAVAASGRVGGPLERMEPLEDDHERALSAIAAVAALVVPSMSPIEIPATELLTIAPIAVSDLPMTAESFSQQK